MILGDKEERSIWSGFTLLIPVFLSVLLLLISQQNYLLFHTLAELFAVIIAVLMCVVAWQMYPFTRNSFLMYLGGGYFWVAMLDLAHALMYKGMNIYDADGAVYAVDIWLAARYFEALILLSAPWYLSRTLRRNSVFALMGLVSVMLYLLVITDRFPDTFIEGKGLTDFKVYSEYFIVGILALAMIYLNSQSVMIDKSIKKIILLSISLTMCAELAFTFYVDLFGLSNIVGHVFKLLSFWLVYMAMIKTTLHEPFRIMARGSSTYDTIPDATIVVDDNGIIRQANIAATELAGVSKSELIGESDHKWFHSPDLDQASCDICTMIRKRQRAHAYEVSFAENQQWFDFTLSPILGASEQDGFVEVIRDITHRKQIEQNLEDVNELKKSIIENLPAMLFVKSADDHRYIEWNKAAEELTGLTRKDMIGKDDYDFFTEEEAASFVEMDKKVLASGKLFDIPEEHIHTKYKGIRLLHTRKIPIFNRQGQASYLLGISQDITEKREIDEVQRRSQKMEVVGQLSGGIAHDFNNQLGIVIGYLEFLKEFVNSNEKQKAWIESASNAAQRCVELTRQLLLFSRTKSTEKLAVDINVTLENIEEIIKKSVTPEVSIFFQLETKLWPVLLDQSELEDAIANVISNARDAMTEGGEIIIRTSNVYLDDEVVIGNHGVQSGEYIMLEIKDNGSGISEEVLEHVFEPFYTTKPVGSGTGLGLSMLYAFVQRYDGTVNIESSVGMGTSVKIYLPKAVDDSTFISAEVRGDRNIVLPKGNETILVVDDENALLNLTEQYVQALGYTVFKASDGREALSILSEQKIDLLFSDIVMPGGMSGFELAETVCIKYPSIKVLLSSGYPGRTHSTGYQGVVLAKPYTRQDLANQLRRLLDQVS